MRITSWLRLTMLEIPDSDHSSIVCGLRRDPDFVLRNSWIYTGPLDLGSYALVKIMSPTAKQDASVFCSIDFRTTLFSFEEQAPISTWLMFSFFKKVFRKSHSKTVSSADASDRLQDS